MLTVPRKVFSQGGASHSLSSAESVGPVCARKQPRRKRKKRRGGEGGMGEGKEGRGGRGGEGKARTSLLSLHLFLHLIPETEEANEREGLFI